MKLTNSMREAFVNAAMNDVPCVDYDPLIRKAVTDAVMKALPPNVRKAYDDESTRHYVEMTTRRYGSVSVYVPGYQRWESGKTAIFPALSKATEDSLAALAAKEAIQAAERKALTAKLKGAAYAVTTRKGLAELLPEFEKYLPLDQPAANRMLPAVANIVADFTKAGWPKGAAKKSKATA